MTLPNAAAPRPYVTDREKAAEAALDAHLRSAHPGVGEGWWDIDCDACDDLAEAACAGHEWSHAEADLHVTCVAC